MIEVQSRICAIVQLIDEKTFEKTLVRRVDV